MADICVGDLFSTYSDFEDQLNRYKNTKFVEFSITDCRTLQSSLKRCPFLIEKIPEAVKYHYVKLQCVHGGNYKVKKGNKAMRLTSTRKQDCKAFIYLKADEATCKLKVSKMYEEHNHDISESLFRCLPSQRRLSPEKKQEVYELLELNKASKTMVQEKMLQTTDKILTLRDLSNISVSDTLSENISFDSMSDSNVSISERQESGRKFLCRPRKRNWESIHKKEKGISESFLMNCNNDIISSNENASEKNLHLSVSSRKRVPFKSIFDEKKGTSTDSQMNCYEMSPSNGNVTDLNDSSSFNSQLFPTMNTNVGKIPESSSTSLKIKPREEVFGKLVACEISDLCEYPDLYLKTKQAILNLLIQAHFDRIKQKGEIL